jgi:hypothetical protein
VTFTRVSGNGPYRRATIDSPEIRYVTSIDGTRLAVAHSGSGPEAVLSSPHSSDRIDAPGDGSRQWLRPLAPHLHVVRFDVRGCGLSCCDFAGL